MPPKPSSTSTISSDTSPSPSKEPISYPPATRTTHTKSSCPISSRANPLISLGPSLSSPSDSHYQPLPNSPTNMLNQVSTRQQTKRRSPRKFLLHHRRASQNRPKNPRHSKRNRE